MVQLSTGDLHGSRSWLRWNRNSLIFLALDKTKWQEQTGQGQSVTAEKEELSFSRAGLDLIHADRSRTWSEGSSGVWLQRSHQPGEEQQPSTDP